MPSQGPKSDKKAGRESQREPASCSAFPMFKSPPFGSTIFLCLAKLFDFCVAEIVYLNILPSYDILDFVQAEFNQISPVSSSHLALGVLARSSK